MDWWVMLLRVFLVVAAMVLVLSVVGGVFYIAENNMTDDGVYKTKWVEVTPPHQGLRCWATGAGDGAWGWCESQ